MRIKTDLNFGWRFAIDYTSGQEVPSFDDSGFSIVDIPHTVRDLPFNCVDATVTSLVSCYRKAIMLPSLNPSDRAFLQFEGVATLSRIFLNGRELAEHRGSFTPFRVDITSAAVEGENLLAVVVDSREHPAIPPFGKVVDYLVPGGIYREVSLELVSGTRIEELFVRTVDLHDREKQVLVSARILGEPSCELLCTILDGGREVASRKIAVTRERFSTVIPVVNAHLWDVDSPHLYTLVLALVDGSDQVSTRFGFRDARFTSGGFFLNGRLLKLRGLNRHQLYPYAGFALPASAQRADADILKRDFGVNMVRTSHYPQSSHFLDRCDELGILVFTEVPGWQHIGEGEWREALLENLDSMILRDRNHPSIVLWGTRVNESPDCGELYAKTVARARALDPSRQTGGVRNFAGSELLEDVYTYNDFSHSGGKNVLQKRKAVAKAPVPYLVTEHNGHMYPTKSFDCEDIRLEHALRHARVLNAMYGDSEISGAIGWCMADYYTHSDFGSGDGICYHGVADSFRIGKLAASVYASQQDGAAVFELSSSLDIGEHPAATLGRVWAFTNCDEIRVFRNDEPVTILKPDRLSFPHLPHPPLPFDDLIGDALEKGEGLKPKDSRLVKSLLLAALRYGADFPLRYRIKAVYAALKLRLTMATASEWYCRYVQGWGEARPTWRFEAWRSGRLEKTITRSPLRSVHLSAVPDSAVLCPAATWDATRVVLMALDQNGNRLPYAHHAVRVVVEGPASVIGPDCFALVGGGRAFWLRTRIGPEKIGDAPIPVVVRIEAVGIAVQELRFEIRPR